MMAQAFLNGTEYDPNTANVSQFIERTLNDFVVPFGIKIIGPYAFYYLSNMKKITIPEGVERISRDAFSWSGLLELTLPTSCHTLDDEACFGLWSAQKISVGNLKNIGNSALGANNACVEYDFTRCEQVPVLGSEAFGRSYLDKNNARILVPLSLYDEWIVATNWVEWADYIMPVVKAPKFEVPTHVSAGLDIYARQDGRCEVRGRGDCTDSVVVITDECAGAPITRISLDAFNGDINLEELYLMGSVAVVDNNVCSGSSLKKLYMGNVSGIASIAFMCDELEYVRFSNHINYIGGESFYSRKAETVYDFTAFDGDSIPTLDGFEGMTLSPGKILVPISWYEEWKQATNWSYFADLIYPAI